jgi:hypothetical protein
MILRERPVESTGTYNRRGLGPATRPPIAYRCAPYGVG